LPIFDHEPCQQMSDCTHGRPEVKSIFSQLLVVTILLAGNLAASAQGTAFTYQGRLANGASTASGNFDLKFSIFDAPSAGTLIAGPITNAATVIATNGLFASTLDFGAAAFNGPDRWLEIAVRTNGSGSFSTLAPRQRIAPAPYAITAGNLIGALPAGQLAGSYPNAVKLTNAANIFYGNGAGLAGVNAVTVGGMGAGSFWQLSGNAGTVAGQQFMGTKDFQPFELKVNSQRALRLEPNASGPNLIGGSDSNYENNSVGVTVGGGASNSVNIYNFGTIGGGQANGLGSPINQVPGQFATIGGGSSNEVSSSSDFSSIGGGFLNTIQGGPFYGCSLAVIGGGNGNNINNSSLGTIGGGGGNYITSFCGGTTIGGGLNNTNWSEGGTIGGGLLNLINGPCVGGQSPYSTISGGTVNSIDVYCLGSTVAGGSGNQVLGGGPGFTGYATIGGGHLNVAKAMGVTVAGGSGNSAINNFAAIAGGTGNTASGAGSFVGGGGTDGSSPAGNAAVGASSAICGGNGNSAAGGYSTVGGGSGNAARCDFTSVLGGANNSTTGNYATIPGGLSNTATNYAFAAGRRAKANHQGCFVWADSTDADFVTAVPNSAVFRCGGGVGFYSGMNGANQQVTWAPGSASWSFSSDRNLKEGFKEVNSHTVLDKVAQLDLSEWNYKGYPQRHIGPMAQDFHALFPLNDNDTTLNDADLHGVELAAIKGLNHKVDERNTAVEAQLKEKDLEIQQLKQRLDALEKLVSHSLAGANQAER
jgi:hypothetical protein